MNVILGEFADLFIDLATGRMLTGSFGRSGIVALS